MGTDGHGLIFLPIIFLSERTRRTPVPQADRKIEDRNIRRQEYSCLQIFLSFPLNEIGEIVLKIRDHPFHQ
jgi:hypothetical protein